MVALEGRMLVRRVFSTPGVHPYAEVSWERRDVRLTNWRDGSVGFAQAGVEFPDFWAQNAVDIVTSRYFAGPAGGAGRESSLRQLIDRVVGRYAATAREHGYLATDAEAELFAAELTWLLLHQAFSFNSPVWFNVGTAAPQVTAACFILAADDSMEAILNWYREEGLIFKAGAGAGVNLSRIRSSREPLSGGGSPSGPVSFMRAADASAGAIKSGGATRRAAKMVVLDVDHPDIAEFVGAKAGEEAKIRALRDAGFDVDLGGRDLVSVQYQNANNSVRLTDEFLRAVEAGAGFELRARGSGEVLETVDARALFRSIAAAAWDCADPGVQYDDTINDWHTNPDSGRITASNPCGEFLSLDNSSCNLASLNLLAFLAADGQFQADRFAAAVELAVTALDVSLCFAEHPTEQIAATTRGYRQLGLGYAGLGALLMATGRPYDSAAGRALAAALTSLLTAVAYRRSAELAGRLGAYDGFRRNAGPHRRVVRRHAAASAALLPVAAEDARLHALAEVHWQAAVALGDRHGYRNAQVTLLAPTGTIGLMMDCDTFGVEPDLALVKRKKLADGGVLRIVNRTLPRALRTLGYPEEQVEAIVQHVTEHGSVLAAPGLRTADRAVFDCAVGPHPIAPMGHLRMMAAVQPFLSGGISKTVNLPPAATVEDVEQLYLAGWRLGLKALSVYRDGCKVGQPLTAEVGQPGPAPATTADPAVPVRRRLPRRGPGMTTRFSVGGADGRLTASCYPDGGLGEVVLMLGKQGSPLAGITSALSAAVSAGLQHGIGLETFVAMFTGTRFEPGGVTDDPDVRIATSVLDYVVRRLALDHLPPERCAELGIHSTAGPAGPAEPAGTAGRQPVGRPDAAPVLPDAPLCLHCGAAMRRTGSCHVCESCGSTSGCS
jgi:ribonucleoside-diphosphate reductase alpha chain